MRAVSGRHAECCAAARSMTAGNFEFFSNNSILVNLYMQFGAICKAGGAFAEAFGKFMRGRTVAVSSQGLDFFIFTLLKVWLC